MNEFLLEPFLTQYYLFESVCGDFITDRRRREIFYEYASIFCLPKNAELDAYYRDSHSEPFNELNDFASYSRLCRTIDFAQRGGQDVGMTSRDKMILSKKREALLIKSEVFKQTKNLTQETVNTLLLDMASNGSIDAMTLVSFMEFHGISVCPDSENAVKRIRLCAKWNNLFGNLMGLAYDKGNEQEYFDNLFTILRNANQKQIFQHICDTKGFTGECNKNPVARIIDKAFGLNIANRGFYDKVFAKIAFSELISAEDKEKLLLNKQKDAIVSLSDFPFDVKREDDSVFNRDAIGALPIKRDAEILKIIQNLEISQSCPDEVYTPLLIVAPDEFISNMYHDFISDGLEDCPVIEQDADTLAASNSGISALLMAEERAYKINKAFESAIDSDAEVYKVLTWMAHSLFMLNLGVDRTQSKQLILMAFEKRTLFEISDMVFYAAAKAPRLKIADRQKAKIEKALNKSCDDTRVYGAVRYNELFMQKGEKATISDWVHKMNKLVIRTVQADEALDI